jgi:hypothetical protein
MITKPRDKTVRVNILQMFLCLFNTSNSAKLAISIARKMNALIFLVPEDIVDVRSKLVRSLTSYG